MELWMHDERLYKTKKRFSSKFILINLLDNLLKNKKKSAFYDLVQYS